MPPRSDPPDRLHEHLWLRPAHGPRPHNRARGADPRARDHGRGGREGPRRRVSRRGRPRVRAVQHRLRALSQLQAAGHRHLPHREPRAARSGVRLRRHGRLGRRAGRVRDGPVRGLQLPQVPRQGAGDGEDPRPDDAVGHLPDRLPRLRHGRREAGEHGLRRRCGTGRPRGRPLRPAARGGGRDRRRSRRGAPEAGRVVRLRDRRRVEGRSARPDRADPRRAGGRRRRRRGRLRGPRPRRGRRDRASGHRAQQPDEPHPRGRQARHPRALRHGRPGRLRRRGEGGLALHPDRAGLGQVAQLRDRPVSGDEVPPRPDAGDPQRSRADRQGRQRAGDLARRGPAGLQGLRQGRVREVRDQPERARPT